MSPDPMSPDDRDLSALVRQHATRHAAPDELRATVRTQAALTHAGRADRPRPAGWPGAAWHRAWPSFSFEKRTAAAGFALGLACAVLLMPLLPQWDWRAPLDAELVADHVRAMQIGPLSEVISTDRHTVKPWFQGRLDYAPPVFDLTDQGFPLMGGRLEHVRGQAVAALTYARNRHVIDVFVWPSEERPQAVAHLQHRGFHLLHWSDGAMQIWVVSDLERGEIERFGQQWRDRAARP